MEVFPLVQFLLLFSSPPHLFFSTTFTVLTFFPFKQITIVKQKINQQPQRVLRLEKKNR